MLLGLKANQAVGLTHFEGLPRADDAVVQRVHHVQHVVPLERHLPHRRRRVVEVRPGPRCNSIVKFTPF